MISNVGELIAALWTTPAHTKVEVLFERDTYEISRITEETEDGESLVLLRIEERKRGDKKGEDE
jgi:hypothetical protein